MSAVSMRTTTVKYQTKPQAAVQYEIALLSGALVYNPNQSEEIKGKLEWRVYKIEGDQRLPMSNSQKGMKCYCGYSDSPSTKAGVDTTDNVTFNDGGAAQVAYNSNSTKQFTIIYGSVTGSVFTQLARLDVPVNVIGKDAAVVASIDFDNNNATLLYNSSKGVYANSAVANVSLLVGGEDKSNTATITFKSHGVNAAITRGGETTSIKPDETPVNSPNRTGIISVKATSLKDDSTSSGYITATYTDSFGIDHTATFNVTRSVGRYAVDIIATPTQISYNQTTGKASSSTVVAKINAIDINGKKTDGASFSSFGAMNWRYIGATDWTTYAPDPNSGQSASVLEITNLDFTKNGIEFLFTDGSGNQLDYETVPFSSVSNGGDAYLVNVASMNVAVVLTSISYGTPTGDVTNVVYMTKNNAVLPSGVRYDVPGDDGEKYALATDSDTANNVSYSGWVFNYSYQEGRLKSSLVRVNEGSPTSVHIPIDVIYPTDNITRSVMISYSAIQKGPAGRSYKPNTPELYDPKKKYVWNDKQRDFIYYAFKVNEKGEQDDEKGVLSYFQYGVKKYDNNGSVTDPPTAKGGDDNWEYVSEYKSIIVNCLFGTNAVLGGMVFTADTQTSVKETNGKPNIVINGQDGTFVANKAIIRGEIHAKGGTFDNCIIKDTCTITKIKATSGTIGGFEINGDSIGKSDGMSAQKGMSLFGDFICFNDNDANGTYQRQAILGTTSYLGSKFLMRLIDNAPSYDDHTGIVFDIQNSLWNKNHAFLGNGDGVLNGVIQGYKLNVMTSGLIDISKGNTVYCNGGSSNYLVLPTLANCKNVLGTTGAFALDLTIIGASGARDFGVYGKHHYPTTTDCYLLNNDHGDDWYATMSQGDVLTLKLIYTGSAFYAYIVSSMQ